jgi:hypothetical protein
MTWRATFFSDTPPFQKDMLTSLPSKAVKYFWRNLEREERRSEKKREKREREREE